MANSGASESATVRASDADAAGSEVPPPLTVASDESVTGSGRLGWRDQGEQVEVNIGMT
jgi:hypothetical protein